MKRILNVLHQSDDNYSKICYMSIMSILDNNTHLDEINIYYVGYKITKANIQKLERLGRQYRNCNFYYINGDKYHKELKTIGVRSWRGLYITWMKLLAINDIKLNTDRILYLNAHTIVTSSLDNLLDFDFKGKLLGLSYDCLINDHKETIGLNYNSKYYNCGVMLINHKKWISDNVNQYVIDKLKEKNDYVIVDQDFCNDVFRDNIALLGVEYNYSSAYYGYDIKKLLKVNKLYNKEYFYSYDDIMSEYYSPKIIHSLFGITGKPWERGNKHPNSYLWNKYKNKSPWKDDAYPRAKYNINWFLYDILPKAILMKVYKYAVYNKYGKKKRNKVILFLDRFTPQKGT